MRLDRRMQLRAATTPPATVEAEVLAVPIYREDAELPADLDALDRASGGAIRRAIDWGEFNVIEHPSALVPGGDLVAQWLLLINAGRRGRGAWRARRLASVATRRLQGRGTSSLALWLRDGENADAWEAAAVGAVFGTYRTTEIYGRVRDTDAMRRSVPEVMVLGDGYGDGSQAALDRG